MPVTESDQPSMTRSGRSTPAACDVLAGEVLPADRRGDAAERVLVGAGEFQHLCGLRCGDIRRIGSARADAVTVDPQHGSSCGFAVMIEDAHQHLNDEFHRRMVVVQEQHLDHRSAGGRFATVLGHVHAINRRGRTDERVDWIGTPDRPNELLEEADVLLISASLTRATYGLIGAAELGHMKDDAILVNLARGEIVQERPLYDHLVGHPRFTACIDAWWIEPVRHGEFRIDQPFLSLRNVIASPHNSAQSEGAHDIGLRRAVENCRRALTGEMPLHVIGLDERLVT
jgi:hypothetical protein